MDSNTIVQFTDPNTGLSYRWDCNDESSLERLFKGEWLEIPAENDLGNVDLEQEEQEELDKVYALVKQWGFPGIPQ